MKIPKPYVVQGDNLLEVLAKYEKDATAIISDALQKGSFLKVANMQVLHGPWALTGEGKGKVTVVFFTVEDEMAVIKLQMEEQLGKASHMIDTINSDMRCPNEAGHEWGTDNKCIHCGYQL